MDWSDFTKIRWIKHSDPVLTPGDRGRWDDYATITPSVWKESDSKYYMFYTGQGYETKNWGVGLAVSNDLIHWEKPFKKPLVNGIQHDKISSIDGAGLFLDKCYYMFFESKSKDCDKRKIRDVLVPKSIKKYLIAMKWYFKDRLELSMALRHAEGRKIWCMDSENSLSWDISRARIIFDADKNGWDCNGVFSPRVFRFRDKFYLLYGGSDGKKINTGMATSPDLHDWRRVSLNPILIHGDKGDWDENHALMVDIVKLEDGFVGFYEGEDKHNRYRIGIVHSEDLLGWEKFGGNPILDIGPKRSFDERMVCSPHVIVKNAQYLLFYSAHNRYMQGYCGFAEGGL